MAMTDRPEKESTILSLSEDIQGSLKVLQGKLDNCFNRREVGTVMKEGESSPNILDDIIDNLKLANTHIININSFLVREVLPKIK